MFVNLNQEQIKKKRDFVKNYICSQNAADSSFLDPNANVTSKNIATMETEIHKDINIQINRKLVYDKIESLFGSEIAEQYLQDIKEKNIYIHDETSLKPYCVSVSMYPFLLDGLKTLGGEGKAPSNLHEFCSGFVNLVFAIASQFAGAVATVEFLMYFDYFARQELGEEYITRNHDIVLKLFNHIVYSINQPAAARGYQSVFWNISIYDKEYFNAMFGNFVFPDGTKPSWNSVNDLQKIFMKWFNVERSKSLLTYPVVTAACLRNENEMIDKEFEDFISTELSEGNAFFIFMNDSPYALSSCCRLKNDIQDNINEFSYTLGAGGVSTGSINVITINLNRVIQTGIDLKTIVKRIHKYQYAYLKLIEEYKIAKLLPVYDAGYISLDRQYLTIGINGLVEAAEFAGHSISLNDEYMQFVENILQIISDENKIAAKKYKCKFNTEFVPAENLGVKNAHWDRRDGLKVTRDCYNSYLYKVEDEDISILDKFALHGKRFMQYLDGGSAYHCNLEEYPTKETFKKLLSIAAKEGCEYFCFNIKITICNECSFIDKRTHYICQKCGTKNVDFGTRVIGYLKRISSFGSSRRTEEGHRYYG